MILRQPTREECQQVRIWRNDPAVLPMLRTKEPLTEAQQDAFYDRITANPMWPHAYFALEQCGQFVGLGGLTHIRLGGDEAEISLILGPEFRGRGFGSLAVDALLERAKEIGLGSVVGECYANGNQGFWREQLIRRPAQVSSLNFEGSLWWRWTL